MVISTTPKRGRKVVHYYWMLYVFIAAAALLYFIKISGFPIAASVAFAIGVLIVSGVLLTVFGKLKNSFFGFNMISTQRGISLIDRLSKSHPKLWTAFADWGLAMGFGLLSHFMFKGQISKRILLLGIITNLFLLIVVYPYLQLTLGFVNIPQIATATQAAQAANQGAFSLFGFTLIGLVELFAVVIGGFSLFIFVLISYFGLNTFYQIGIALLSSLSAHPNYSNLNSVAPGLAPIIPGIDIPLIGGLLAFLVVIVCHEFLHGILGRIYNLKVKSIGAMLLGIIPIGAFVELDEKQLVKLKKIPQSRIFIAGITANLFLTLVFFALFMVFIFYIVPNIESTSIVIAAVVPNSPASHYLTSGSTVLNWNSFPIKNISDIIAAGKTDKPLTNVSVVTNVGSYVIKTNSTGKVGVDFAQVVLVGSTYLDQFLYIAYSFVSLAFLLSFLVGVLNLLPIPLFDGWRIYSVVIKNKVHVKMLAIFIFIMLVSLALPWIWQA